MLLTSKSQCSPGFLLILLKLLSDIRGNLLFAEPNAILDPRCVHHGPQKLIPARLTRVLARPARQHSSLQPTASLNLAPAEALSLSSARTLDMQARLSRLLTRIWAGFWALTCEAPLGCRGAFCSLQWAGVWRAGEGRGRGSAPPARAGLARPVAAHSADVHPVDVRVVAARPAPSAPVALRGRWHARRGEGLAIAPVPAQCTARHPVRMHSAAHCLS